MNVSEFLSDKIDRVAIQRAERQRHNAAVARLNWRVETRDLIKSEVLSFSSRGHGRWVFMPAEVQGTSFQVELHTDELLAKKFGEAELVREGSASIVYSFHPNGSVAVVVYPHSSVHAGRAKPGGTSQHFIIDVVPHVWQLAGHAGRKRIRRHLREFGKFAAITRAHAYPTPSSGRFLRRLEEKADRFAFVFQSPGEARVHRLSQESNLGIGLIAGLIASTILPLARDYGKELAARTAESMKTCTDGFPEGGDRLQTCLNFRNYVIEIELAKYLSTGAVLTMALLLTMGALLFLRRMLRQR